VLVAAVALVYVAVFVWQPEIALLTYISLRPLVDAFVFEGFGGFTLGEVWGIGMVVSAALFLLLQGADGVQRIRMSAMPLAFLLFLAVLTFTRPELITAVAGWTRVASWVLVMVCCEHISRRREGQRMCWAAGMGMGAALIVSVSIMIFQGRFGSAFYGDPLREIAGQLPHPLAVGAVLLLPFALAGALLLGRRVVSLLIATGLVAAIIQSYVRTALLGALFVLAALLAVAARGTGRARMAGLAVATGVALAAYATWDRISERFADLTLLSESGAAQGGAGSGRLAIWRTAIDNAFADVRHAIIGRGAGAAETIMTEALGIRVGAQNDLLDFLLAGGLLLASSYLVLLVWMTSRPWRMLRDPGQSGDAQGFALLTLGAVVAFAVMSMLNGIATYQPSVAVGLLVGLSRGMSSTPGRTFLDATDDAPPDDRQDTWAHG
jgi:O-antigen ligase